MDNFRKHRRNIRRPQTIDGFVSQNQRPHYQQQGNTVSRQPQIARTPAQPGAVQNQSGRANNLSGITRTSHQYQQKFPAERQAAEHSNRPAVPNQATSATRPLQPDYESINLDLPDEHKSRNVNPFRPDFWNRRRAFGAMATMLIVVGGIFGGRILAMINGVFSGGGESVVLQEKVDITTLKGEGDGRVNILLVGKDAEGEGLTDSILLASINPIQKESALVSIPRDLYVQRESGAYSKINAVFPETVRQYLESADPDQPGLDRKADEAGIRALQNIVESKIGLPIHYYGMVDLKGFKKGINTVGGLDVNVPEELAVLDYMRFGSNNYTLDVNAGQNHFDGLKAMAYVRSRYTSQRGDFDRAERQRLILTAFKGKVLSAGTFGNPAKVANLMDDFSSHIRTNLGVDEAMRLYDIAKEIGDNKISSIGLADPPHELLVTDMVNGQSVVIPRAGLDSYGDLQHYVRNKLRDGFLAKEDAKVLVLNGTTIPELASRTAEHLKSFGYTVNGTDDAPTAGYYTTMVVDQTGGKKKFTRRYLENRFYTGAVSNLPDPQIETKDADFIIILGQNEQTRLSSLPE